MPMNPYQAPASNTEKGSSLQAKPIQLMNAFYMLIIAVAAVALSIYSANPGQHLPALAASFLAATVMATIAAIPFHFGYLAAKTGSAAPILKSIKSNFAYLLIFSILWCLSLISTSSIPTSLVLGIVSMAPLVLNLAFAIKSKPAKESISRSNDSSSAES